MAERETQSNEDNPAKYNKQQPDLHEVQESLSELASGIYGTANILFPYSATGQSLYIAATCQKHVLDPTQLGIELLADTKQLHHLKFLSENSIDDSPFHHRVKLGNLRKTIKKVFEGASAFQNTPLEVLKNVMNSFHQFELPPSTFPVDLLQESHEEKEFKKLTQNIIQNSQSEKEGER